MQKRESTLREYFEALLIAVIFLGFTNGFLVKTFYIPSASMEDTLLIGDHLFVNRFIYGSTEWDWEEKILPLRLFSLSMSRSLPASTSFITTVPMA